jgi:hypothetical protein
VSLYCDTFKVALRVLLAGATPMHAPCGRHTAASIWYMLLQSQVRALRQLGNLQELHAKNAPILRGTVQHSTELVHGHITMYWSRATPMVDCSFG